MRWLKYIVVFLGLVTMLLPSIAAADRYIAVYINPKDLNWASAQGNSLQQASRRAAQSCGSGCRRAGYSRNACVALAIRNDKGTCYGATWGNNLAEARRKALDICRGYGCRCRIIFSECYR